METENKELFDFEKNDNDKQENNKEKKNFGKKASAAAMAGAAGLAGGATALGAEAAMSLSDEMIVDPEMIAEGLEDSTIKVSTPRHSSHHAHHEADAAAETPLNDEQTETIMSAAEEVTETNGVVVDEDGNPLPQTDGEEPEVIAQAEPVELEEVTGEDIAQIIDGDETVTVTDDDFMPICEDTPLLADADDLDGDIQPDDNDLTEDTCIDDLIG